MNENSATVDPAKSSSVPVGQKLAHQGASPFRGAKFYLLFGFAVLILLIGSMSVWSATSQISGAIIASGTVVVDGNVKKIQHPTGGVVAAIYVQEGDKVQAGDLLVRLDDTVTRANQQVLSKQLDEVAVRKARLIAEHNDQVQMEFPATLLARRDEHQLAQIMSSELSLFEARRRARDGQKAQLRERIAQLRQEIAGLDAQHQAKLRELALAREELAGLEILEGKNLVSTTKITAARRGTAQLEGDLARILASAAQARGKIAEIKLQIAQLDQDLKTEVAKDLRDDQAKEAELSERLIAAQDVLTRIDIRAPKSGRVHELAVHTVGGVITPSEPIMKIVPDADRLVIEARVAAKDIGQVAVGHTAEIRFTAFNYRTTPTVQAFVTRVSADVTKEQQWDHAGVASPSGSAGYYLVRLEVDGTSPKDRSDLKLVPGMPAEVMIKTLDRTVLSYLVRPVTDQFARAFRER